MKIAAVILAAGKGTRMGEVEGSVIPKVMFKAHEKPLIEYSINNVISAGIDSAVLVVGYKREMIMGHIGESVQYAIQEEQLGTGHAAKMAKDYVANKYDAVLICYGDMPLYKPETIKNLVELYEKEQPTIAMLSVEFNDPDYWAYGRIIRNQTGEITGIVEQKDCTSEQLEIKESNPGFYIFDNSWIWEALEHIGSNNAQHEYYLTDLIAMAIEQGKKVIAVPVLEEEEVLGVNTPDQLKQVEDIIDRRIQ